MSDVIFSPLMVSTALVPVQHVGPRATTANESGSKRVASNPRGARTKPRVSDAKITALLAKFGRVWKPGKAT